MFILQPVYEAFSGCEIREVLQCFNEVEFVSNARVYVVLVFAFQSMNSLHTFQEENFVFCFLFFFWSHNSVQQVREAGSRET